MAEYLSILPMEIFGKSFRKYAKKYSGVKVVNMGIEDAFVEHGTVAELQNITKLDATSIAERIKNIIERKA